MKIISRKKIYLDYASATPLDGDVLKVINKLQKDNFANASAIYADGVKSRNIIDKARNNIAKLLNAHQDEIIFTGSGTESSALVIWGCVNNYKGDGLPHIVTTTIEHSAVLENCHLLESLNKAQVTYVSCDNKGFVDPREIKDAIRPNTILVSVMYANNEIGTIQPIMEIAKEIRHYRKSNNSSWPLLYTDAAQAMNYLFTENIEKLGVDLLSFNSSKIYGPKGLGVLYKKRSVSLASLYGGGGQEFGLRSGTENTALISGASLALQKVCSIKEREVARLTKLRDYCIEELLKLSAISGYSIILNGDQKNRLPNNINISIANISSELLVIELDAKGIMVSERSACGSSGSVGSHVLEALYKDSDLDLSKNSLRITLGQYTKKADIDIFIKALKDISSKYNKWK